MKGDQFNYTGCGCTGEAAGCSGGADGCSGGVAGCVGGAGDASASAGVAVGGHGAGGPPSAIFIYVLCKNDYVTGKRLSIPIPNKTATN